MLEIALEMGATALGVVGLLLLVADAPVSKVIVADVMGKVVWKIIVSLLFPVFTSYRLGLSWTLKQGNFFHIP